MSAKDNHLIEFLTAEFKSIHQKLDKLEGIQTSLDALTYRVEKIEIAIEKLQQSSEDTSDTLSHQDDSSAASQVGNNNQGWLNIFGAPAAAEEVDRNAKNYEFEFEAVYSNPITKQLFAKHAAKGTSYLRVFPCNKIRNFLKNNCHCT